MVRSDTRFDVKVVDFLLESSPARITTYVRVAGKTFYSRVTYHTIPSWDDLWGRVDVRCRPQILGALVAWDCMRFLALGGETLELCDGLELDASARATWRHCFLNQFGEWRYRNQFRYRNGDQPLVICRDPLESVARPRPDDTVSCDTSAAQRWLVTNGGGKDSLVGMMLLGDAGVPFDVYEGCLPIGGASEVQTSLLANLRAAATANDSRLISVTIEDDFFSTPDDVFRRLGVRTEHFKSDFAVGHTANYPGYFPLILYHGYSRVWFNIEASADRTMARWNGEDVNHQWCKSQEYHECSSQLFRELTGDHRFEGFSSTLRGIHDSVIYRIAGMEEDLLRMTHSCNLNKPWCRRCAKCCFSYLMMSAIKGEPFAQEVVGATESLFEAPELATIWRDLLDVNHVAWECVPSHEECLLAVRECLRRGIRYPVLDRYAHAPEERLEELRRIYHTIDWSKVPAELRRPMIARIARASVDL